MSARDARALAEMAIELVEAGYTPETAANLPEVRRLTQYEEDMVIETMENLLG